MAHTKIVSIYDQHVITAEVSGCKSIPVDDHCTITPTRATAVYGRQTGMPWGVITARINGLNQHGVHDDAVLALREEWPAWLVRWTMRGRCGTRTYAPCVRSSVQAEAARRLRMPLSTVKAIRGAA